ncbi:type VI secretion system protein ImpA [Duganella sp. 1411]|uniref:type VI secretion system protein TssA n=1 Tax=Duganella sp. 1411 TaxID=2806572 RepID=UPI001AE85321|nr:type VI secretion system protein TssA [Duganella sp. 1411]MBP1203935.1 type VI secretion system protein ImpA [Duganella sp. 1411]
MFSIAQLLLPISAERICGDDLSFSGEVDAIARARTFDDPTLDQGEWVAVLKEADWEFVGSRCAGMIETQTKDLRLAAWLAEALAKTRGLRGLGDGYAVLSGLCEHYWEGLHPLPEDGDYDQRIGNLYWLLTRTPVLVREMPQADGGALLPEAEYCLAMLTELERVVDRRLGAEGPGFSAAKDALQAVVSALAPAGGHAAMTPGGETGAGVAGQGAPATFGGQVQNRAQALQQLRVVADFFRRTEPHSPVAYLADKAASWGDMPLHVWLRAVIKDPGTIAGVEELLGSQPPGE